MKSEGSGSKGTRVIERKRSVTDGQKDRQPDGQDKNNMSPPEAGNIISIENWGSAISIKLNNANVSQNKSLTEAVLLVHLHGRELTAVLGVAIAAVTMETVVMVTCERLLGYLVKI